MSSQQLPLPPAGFDDLAVEDKIKYVQALWDRIAANTDQVPLHEWQEEILRQRLAEHRANPEQAVPWEDVIDRVRSRLRRNLR